MALDIVFVWADSYEVDAQVTGLVCARWVLLITKYGFDISAANVVADINRLTNQLWKLIPMRENGEDWKSQLQTAIIELVGLNEILNLDEQFLILLSKLEGLKVAEIDVLDDNIYDYAFNMFEEYLNLLEKYTEEK